MISVVTSCSAKGWEEYGQRFVRSFAEHWPAEIPLHLVSEDDLTSVALEVPFPKQYRVMSLWSRAPQARAFHERHEFNPRMHGRERMPKDVGWTPKKQDRGYNFRYDAYRFAKKVFAIDLVAKEVECGRLFWIDADVVTFDDVPIHLLERMLPTDVALSCLDRGDYHSECGFVGYNLDHPQCREFIAAFADLYASDRVFELQEWHDSWVFDWLRREMNIPTFAIPHNSRHHPFVNSDLGKVMDHLKGARKAKGKTPVAEVLSSKKREMDYWRTPA